MHFQLTFGKAQIAGYNPSSKALFRSSKVEEIWLLKRIGIKVYGLNENLDLVQKTKKEQQSQYPHQSHRFSPLHNFPHLPCSLER